jgi:hypothetical protein
LLRQLTNNATGSGNAENSFIAHPTHLRVRLVVVWLIVV